jgi:AFG3 family protein
LEKKNLVMSPVEKKTVAFHEAGHAVAGWFLEHAMPLLKVSIIPRGTAALGYAQYQPMERNLYSKEALLDHMCMTLAGRASEEIFFDTVTSGASDDFSKVTRMAYQSVAEWGLGKTIGKLAYGSSGGGQEDFYKPYSDRTARLIDEEVREMVSEAYTRTKQLLHDRREDVTKVANLLLEREAIGHNDMVRMLGIRPYGDDRNSFEQILADAGKIDNHGGIVAEESSQEKVAADSTRTSTSDSIW